MAENCEGLVVAVSVSAVRMNDAPRSIKELAFSHFPNLNESWRIAKPESEHVVEAMIRP